MCLDTKMEQEDKGNDETPKSNQRKCTSPYKGTLGSLQEFSTTTRRSQKTIQEYIQRGEEKRHQSRAAHSVKKFPSGARMKQTYLPTKKMKTFSKYLYKHTLDKELVSKI